MAKGVKAFTNDRGEVSFFDPEAGSYVWVARRDANAAARAGFVPETRADHVARIKEEMRKRELDAPGLAFAAGVARGATFGGSDALLTSTGLAKPETLQGLREISPIASGAGEVTGAVGSLAIPGAPVARLAGLSAKAGAGVAGRIAGSNILARGARGVASLGIPGAIEGGALAAGTAVTDQALGQLAPGTLASEIASRAKTGAAVGGVLGVGVGAMARGLGRGAAKAKELRPARTAEEADQILGDGMREIGQLRRMRDALDLDQRELAKHFSPKLSGAIDDAIGATTNEAKEATRRAVDALLPGNFRTASGIAPHALGIERAEVGNQISAVVRRIKLRTGNIVDANGVAQKASSALGQVEGGIASEIAFRATKGLPLGAGLLARPVIKPVIGGALKVLRSPSVAKAARVLSQTAKSGASIQAGTIVAQRIAKQGIARAALAGASQAPETTNGGGRDVQGLRRQNQQLRAALTDIDAVIGDGTGPAVGQLAARRELVAEALADTSSTLGAWRAGAYQAAGAPIAAQLIGAAIDTGTPERLIAGRRGHRLPSPELSPLSADAIDDLRERAEQAAPEEHRKAARMGYASAGVPQSTADALADYQAARADIIRTALLAPKIDPVRLGRTVAAVQDPRTALARIGRHALTPEDKAVLDRLLPGLSADLGVSAAAALRASDRATMPEPQRRTLNLLAGTPQNPGALKASQAIAFGDIDDQGTGRRSRATVSKSAADLQTLSGQIAGRN